MKYLLPVVVFCLAFSFCGGATTEAASKYKITPRVIDRQVQQRDMFTEQITIENFSTHKISIFPSVNEIATDDQGDITDFISPASMSDKASGVTSWISISRASTELMPGEVLTLPLSVKVNKDAPAGDYQVFIGFGSGQNRTIAERAVAEGQAPGVVLTLAVEQNKIEFLKLDRFSVDRFVADPAQEAITYTLTNPGETTVVPKGEVIFYNGRGDEISSMLVNPDQETLAPGGELIYSRTVPMEGMMGKYKAFLSVDYGTAQLASVYDTAYFYVIPWQQLLIIFVTLMLVAIALTFGFHRRYAGVDSDDDQHGADHLPVHVFEGKSDSTEHDLHLTKK